MGPLLVFGASFVMVFFIALILIGVALGTMLALSDLVERIVVPGSAADRRANGAERYLTDDRP